MPMLEKWIQVDPWGSLVSHLSLINDPWARGSHISKKKLSFGLHTFTPMHIYMNIQKTDQKIKFQLYF